MSSWVFYVTDFFSISLFSVLVYHAVRRGKKYLFELIGGYFYGLLLEAANIMLFGTYFYSDDFLFMIAGVPVAVALGWAGIIYSCMGISDSFGLKEEIKPFFDSILAIFIDLSMDVVAIRLGFWYWGISFNEGWFGVPAGNFVGWMFVVFYYSLLCRIARKKIKDMRTYFITTVVALPFVAYILMATSLLVTMIVFISVFQLYDPTNQLWIFVFQFSLFLTIVIIGSIHFKPTPKNVDCAYKLVPLSFHIFYIVMFIIFEMYRENIILTVSIPFFFLLNEIVIESYRFSRKH